jgi:hypothetical protein
LRRFVIDLLESQFGADPGALSRIREEVGIDGDKPFGFQLKIHTSQMVIDSNSAPLASFHDDELIDLYSLSGRANYNFPDGFGSSRGEVHFVDDSGVESRLQASRTEITDFLTTGAGRLRVYPEMQSITSRKLRTLQKKFKALGIKVQIDGDDRISLTTWQRIPISINLPTEVVLNIDRPAFVASNNLLSSANSLLCEFALLTGFDLVTGSENVRNRGVANERVIVHLPALGSDPFPQVVSDFVAQPAADTRVQKRQDYLQQIPADSAQIDRGDQCISMIEGGRYNPPPPPPPTDYSVSNPYVSVGSYRDVWPDFVFRTVPAHEIGHLMGLCHDGHNLSHIMFSDKKGQGTTFRPDTVFARYYLNGEPVFSLEDAKSAWRFIVDQMPECLDPNVSPPA